MKRKLLSLLLVVALCSTMSTSAFAAVNNFSADEIRQEYLQDPEFYNYLLEYPVEANKVINDAIMALSRPVSETFLRMRAGNPETTHA